jgi:ATP-binding cassette subfamily C protein
VLGGGLLLALVIRPTLRSAHATGERMTEVSTDALALVTRHVDAMKLVKSYGAEERTLQAFGGTIHRSARSAIDATRAHARAHVATIAGSATLLGVALYASIRLLHLDAATILLLTFLFWRLVPRLMDVQQSVRMALHELPGYEVVRRLSDEAAGAREALDRGATGRSGTRPELVSAIAFDAVSFAYAEQPVLREVSCTIAAGRITAFAGASGAGKTTIVDLLLGLLTPTAGTIRVDDRVLERTWIEEWRSTVAYVPQEPLLFHDTILANLRWANPAASVADVWAALASAAADEFVRQLPMGLDTVVGDRGVRLSGGERQRLALARALLRRPALLVLDEATSAIDPGSEEHILRALVALRGSVTIVLVSHRAAPLDRADAVYRLDGGIIRP